MENKSEVRSLLADLGLVRIGSRQDREFQAACAASRYTCYHFCDRWKDWKKGRYALSSRLFHRSRKPSLSRGELQWYHQCVLPL